MFFSFPAVPVVLVRASLLWSRPLLILFPTGATPRRAAQRIMSMPPPAQQAAVEWVLEHLDQVESSAGGADATLAALVLDLRTEHAAEAAGLSPETVLAKAKIVEVGDLRNIRRLLTGPPFGFPSEYVAKISTATKSAVTERAGRRGIFCLVACGALPSLGEPAPSAYNMAVASVFMSDLHAMRAEACEPPAERGKAGTAACAVCGAGGDLKACARCGTVAYCGKEHQLADWKGGHKHSCKQRAQLCEAIAAARGSADSLASARAIVARMSDLQVASDCSRLDSGMPIGAQDSVSLGEGFQFAAATRTPPRECVACGPPRGPQSLAALAEGLQLESESPG